eukprot:TRINITY_DN6078_c0_g1_i1.p1 TRINITY_DN6078_c0_g1~~TRINITY_DN6078_c0_g1_i1.p1  ORF type:complete len:574 (+),score=203.58 TRINITY_DN6078_c0_g1_i1:93-1814(+)
MPPKTVVAKSSAASAQKRNALKPGTVSEGVVWKSSAGDDDGGAFSSVKKKPKAQQQRPQQAAAAAPPRPAAVSKPAPPPPPGYVPGAETVREVKKKPAPKRVQAPAPAAAAPQEDAHFHVVKKKEIKPQQYRPPPQEVSRQGRRIDTTDGRAYTYQQFVQCYGEDDAMQWWAEAELEKTPAQKMAAEREQRLRAQKDAVVVGSEVVQKSKKAEKEEKKAREKAEKAARERAREAEERRLREAEQHVSHLRVKTVKATTAHAHATGIEQLGQSTVYSQKSHKQQASSHVPLPKEKKERRVDPRSQLTAQDFVKKMQVGAAQTKPPPVDIVFKVCLTVRGQDRWYDISELLAKEDFVHAPEFVKGLATSPGCKCAGGFFITRDGKGWSNERTIDEMWMAADYIKGLTKVFAMTSDAVEVLPYEGPSAKAAVGGTADAMTVKMELLRPTLAPEKHTSLQLTHLVKSGAQLQQISVSAYDFARRMLELGADLSRFTTKVEQACTLIAGQPKTVASPEKAQAVAAVQDKLPRRLDHFLEQLQNAFDGFVDKYPEPPPAAAAEEEQAADDDDDDEGAEG